MFRQTAFVIAAAIGLAACMGPTLPADDPRQIALVKGECEIYFAAERQLGQAGTSLTQGCDPSYASSTADIAGTYGYPENGGTAYSETLYRRMIARGMPNEMAMQISKSKAFWDLVALQTQIYSTL
ncbi:hypothetical protein BVC71_11605 [Marivivens niveibacter]|uniref:Uncharacterized protein n=1 Tax=Marivivens niveibacter TaxID=1930667 RepID=A0A251WZH1_9RHOB|nr:hypothetical protein [Marivivens niveibacter]OUD09333.1 hypothetical protein BVC71_11605 [Marivivens niveibacter]